MFTDGKTTAGPPPAPVAAAARASGVIIYCIGLIGSDGIDVSVLNDWATDPDASHVAVTPDDADLEELFKDLAANISKTGATNIVIDEVISPDFVITSVTPPTKGTAMMVDMNTIQWKIDELGVSANEGASLEFFIKHTAQDSGEKQVNQSITYSDTEGNVVVFPDPTVTVECGIIVRPEPCPIPVDLTLGGLLREKGLACGVGDEGGFAPSLESDEAALDLLCEAIERAGFSDVQVQIALDAAASEWYSEGGYLLPKRQVQYSAEGLISRWEELCGKYPICSIEDPLGETDTEGWQELTRRLGQKVQLVGDDLFVTHRDRVAAGVEQGIANAVLIKPNQVGTLTETYLAIEEAKKAGYGVILSHRSGETEDTTIADLAVAWGAGMIKTGAPCRGERTAKYNRLLQIARQTANCRG